MDRIEFEVSDVALGSLWTRLGSKLIPFAPSSRIVLAGMGAEGHRPCAIAQTVDCVDSWLRRCQDSWRGC